MWSGLWTENPDGTGQMCVYLDEALIECEPTYDATAQPMVLNFGINVNPTCNGCPPRPAEGLYLDIDWVRVLPKPRRGRRRRRPPR